MKKKVRVGVIGACITRDIFNSKINPYYKDIFEVVCDDFQMTFPTLMGNIIEYNPKEYANKIDKISDLELEHLYSDLSKRMLNSLYIKQPDILMVDFYTDSNFGVVEYGDSYITNKLFKYNSVELIRNAKCIGKSYSGRRNFDEYFDIWKDAFDRFMDFCKEYIPNTKIIVNKAKMEKTYYDAFLHEIKPIAEQRSPELIDHINAQWSKLSDYAIKQYNLNAIDYGGKTYYGNPKHMWGLDHLHLETNYYMDAVYKTINICMDLLRDNELNAKALDENHNYIMNSTFKYGLSSWKTGNAPFEVRKDDNNEPYLHIDRNGLDTDKNSQIWTFEIEIKEDGMQDYMFSLDVKVEDLEQLDDEKIIACIRTFDKKKLTDYKNCIENYKITLQNQDITNGEWYRINYKFKPKGRYIRIAPYLIRNGNVSFRKFHLYKYDGKEYKYTEALNEIINRKH